MKKNLLKRCVALFIDVLFFSVISHFFISYLFHELGNIATTIRDVSIIVYAFFLKDLPFKNSGVGKKIMGLTIVDNFWKPPCFFHSIKRTFFSCTIGFFIIWRAIFIDKEYTDFFDFEREKLKARVVDKNTLKLLKEKAKKETGFDPKKMSSLYDEYLRSI